MERERSADRVSERTRGGEEAAVGSVRCREWLVTVQYITRNDFGKAESSVGQGYALRSDDYVLILQDLEQVRQLGSTRRRGVKRE